MSKIDFRKEIKKQMKSKKVNTPELARQAGLNVQTLYNFFAGKSDMTTSNIETILKILGFTKLN